jgi:hypothetical protein
MNQRKYCAFISYSHVDKAWAKWLHHALESYRKPKHLASAKAGESHLSSRLTPVFRDQEELPSASDLSFKIRESLEHSENLILICSPSAARSKWVDREVQIFKQMGRSDRIFCLIVDGDPTAIDTVQDCFPPSLRDRYDAHGQLLPDKVEPIAADVRKQGDG